MTGGGGRYVRPARLHVRDVFNARVISLDRDADFHIAPDLRREIYASAAIRANVVVSLEPSDFCDTACLSAIFAAKRQLRARLEIVIPRKHVARRIAALLGWTDELRLHETLAAALTSCIARG